MFKRSRFLLLISTIGAAFSLALVITAAGFASSIHTSNSQAPESVTHSGPIAFAPIIPVVDDVDTTVVEGGTISGQWTAENSPYLITGTVTIPDNNTLIIDPGVQILFDGHYQFIVNGKLTALGTVTDSIYFTSSVPSEDWGGIRLINAHTQSKLEYCHISHGSAEGQWPDNCGGAIYLTGTISTISHCTFIQNRADKWGGAIYMWAAAPTFAYNMFNDNEAGIIATEDAFGNALYIGNGNELLVNHATITGNATNSGYALYVAMGTDLKMRNSIMWDTFSFNFVSGDINYSDFYYAPGQNDSTSATGAGNIAADPRFVDPSIEVRDYTLRFNSPCIDAAAANAPFSNEPQPNGNRANMGCYGNSILATQSMPLFSFETDVVVLETDDIEFDSLDVEDGDGYPTDGFGFKINVTQGSTNLRIYNVGREALEISELQFSDDQFSSNFDELADSISGTIHVGPDSSTVITFIFTPTEIGDASAAVTFIDNDDTSDPQVSLYARGSDPVFEMTPTLVSFPTIPAGDTYTAPVIIENIANPSSIEDSSLYILYLREITIIGNFALVDSLGDRVFRDSIALGQSVEYTAEFTPGSGGEFADSIQIKTNTGIQVLFFAGSATQPEYRWEPDSLEFGVVALGNSETLSFEVWNPGEAPLVLSNAELSDTVNYSFEIESDEIAPDDTIEVTVTFEPVATGTYNNKTLTIETNLPDGDEVTVRLFGTGTSQENYWIGDVGDVTWSSENSPYFLVGDITVPSGQTLTIEPGVEVKCEADFGIIVEGTLDAQGTAGSHINFSTINQSDSTWSGIEFNSGSSSSIISYCVFHRGAQSAATQSPYGGVIRISNSSPVIDNCEFYDNTAECGGAIAVLSWASPVISECNFHDNSATYGGALYLNSYSNATVVNATIIANSATDGGGIFASGADGEISGSWIQSNTASGSGGGVFLGEGTSTEMYLNEIFENVAVDGGGLVIDWYSKPYIHDEMIYQNTASQNGGGIHITDGCTPLITKCLIAENSSLIGRGLYTYNAGSVINHCTFTAESDTVTGWLFYGSYGDKTMINNSIFGSMNWSVEEYEPVITEGTDIEISFSDILMGEGGVFAGMENLNIDPAFTESGPIDERYTLSSSSPLLTASDSGDELGYEGGTSMIGWDITIALLQNPLLDNALDFLFASTIPLKTSPYLAVEQDLVDTLEYVMVDSGYMAEIAPMVYNLPLYQEEEGRPTRAVITYTNIMGESGTDTLEFTARYLASSITVLNYQGTISISCRAVDESGMWGIIKSDLESNVPEGMEFIGNAYEVFSGVAVEDGKVKFQIDESLLAGRSAEKCAVAFWNGETWSPMTSYLNASRSEIWTDLGDLGTYRLVWGENLDITVAIPTQLALQQNYPNPFNPETTIIFAVPTLDKVSLDIYNLMGQKIATLFNGIAEPGNHQVHWNGMNTSGMPVASGVYFYKLQLGSQVISKKMVLLR